MSDIAAYQDLPIPALEVEVTGPFDPRAGTEGFDDIPVHPQNLAYTVRIASAAEPARVQVLHARLEATCPILNLLRRPQSVTDRFVQDAAPRLSAKEIAL